MKKLLFSLFVLGITSVLAIGATTAYFSDTETSSANTFTAGTLDLKLDGGDTNVIKFTPSNLKPGSQPKGTFRFLNDGSLSGKLILSNVNIIDHENGRIDPEKAAGDTTDGIGELSSVVNLRIFYDIGKDGWISTGDPVLFNGKVNTLSAPLTLIDNIPAGNEENVVFLFDWWNTADDNKAQGDDFTLDLSFTLEQI